MAPGSSKQQDSSLQTPQVDTQLPGGLPELPADESAKLPSPYEHAALIQEIKETADRLAEDQASRGDLKILSRTLRELRYAFKVFRPFRRHRKVTIFGSARTPATHPAYHQAREFARQMAEQGWMVLTGAGGGIMEAGHEGAGIAKSMGVNIMLPFEQSANPIIAGDEKLVHLKYFFTRKLLFVKEVHAIALFPGGFGSMDEAFEALTLVQTGKHEVLPIICVDEPGGTYWTSWRQFIVEQLLNRGLISPEDMSLFTVTDQAEEAVRQITQFYRVYDSMRFVRRNLVLRVKAEMAPEWIEQLNHDFADIVVSGKIERVPAHAFEADDDHLAELPRLSFHFNRRHYGRLRQMIDTINRSGESAN